MKYEYYIIENDTSVKVEKERFVDFVNTFGDTAITNTGRQIAIDRIDTELIDAVYNVFGDLIAQRYLTDSAVEV